MNKFLKYCGNVLLGLDQLGNTLWGGAPDETISSRLGRIKTAHGGKIPLSRPWPKLLDFVLDKIDRGHSIKSIERDEFSEIKSQSVFDGNEGTIDAKMMAKFKALYWAVMNKASDVFVALFDPDGRMSK